MRVLLPCLLQQMVEMESGDLVVTNGHGTENNQKQAFISVCTQKYQEKQREIKIKLTKPKLGKAKAKT